MSKAASWVTGPAVKAVGGKYPLRGKLIVSDAPFVRGYPTLDTPPPGEVWLDSRLFPALGVSLGDTLEVGLAELTVGRVLVAEPDRGGSFFDLGPRLLMNMQDVPATEVVQPGSRLSYRLLLGGPEADLEDLKDAIEEDLQPNYRWVSIRESSPRIGSALDRAESFLLLGGLLGVLLAGIAVALSAHRYAGRHYDHVGVLKTLGATPNQILFGYLNILLLVVGCLFEVVAAILVLGPLLMTAAMAYGIDPIHFGIIMVINLEIGFLTPPIGLNLIVAMTAFKEKFGEICVAVLPFIGIIFTVLMIVTFWEWPTRVLLE